MATTQGEFYKLLDSVYRRLLPLKTPKNHDHAKAERDLVRVRDIVARADSLLEAGGIDKRDATTPVPGLDELAKDLRDIKADHR